MPPVVTDRVAWSVYVLVSLSVTVVSSAKTAEPIEMPFRWRTWLGPRNHALDPPQERVILRGKEHRNTLWRAVQKRLNWSRCRLGCWLEWTQENVLGWVALHTGATCWIPLNHPCAPCGGDAAFCQITLTTCYLLLSYMSIFNKVYCLFLWGNMLL